MLRLVSQLPPNRILCATMPELSSLTLHIINHYSHRYLCFNHRSYLGLQPDLLLLFPIAMQGVLTTLLLLVLWFDVRLCG